MRWLIVLLFMASPAGAQSPAIRMALSGSGSGYQGPQDALGIAPKFFYSIRALSASVASKHSKVINIRRASDNATRDISVLSNGDLDQATAATFGTGTTLFVTEFYDQTGKGFNATQGTAAAQCGLALYSANSGALPRATCAGAQTYAMVTPGAIVQPWTMAAVATNTVATGLAQLLGTATNGKPNFAINNSTSTGVSYCQYTSNFQSGNFATFNKMVAQQCVVNGASSVINSNGSETNGTTGTAGNSDTDWGLILASSLTGDIEEVSLWTTGFTATQRATMCHNMWNYWRSQTPC